MSTTNRRQIDIDLRRDLGAEVPAGEPDQATLEIAYGDDGGRTIELVHGMDEWTLIFDENGQCTDRDPPTRPLPGWVSDAVELVKSEIR